VEHLEYRDLLRVLKMKHDVFADHQAVVEADRFHGEQTVELRKNPAA
jgi:hypothetical protein